MVSAPQTGQDVVCSDLVTLGERGPYRPRRHTREVTTESFGTVLVIDDEEETTKTFAWVLRSEGFQVRTALNAETGLHEAESTRPDAIILDLEMPRVDGLGFLQRLRARDEQRETPVAIVTGDYFLNDAVAAELRQLGAIIKFKPLWLEDLVELAYALIKADGGGHGRHS